MPPPPLVWRDSCTHARPAHGANASCLAAGIGTKAARTRALLAMLCLVPRALVATCFTELGAGLTQRSCELAAARHEACREPANLRAIHIECDALAHHLDIILTQACTCTDIARQGAGIAGIDRRLKLLGLHFSLPFFLVDEGLHFRSPAGGAAPACLHACYWKPPPMRKHRLVDTSDDGYLRNSFYPLRPANFNRRSTPTGSSLISGTTA